MAGYIGSKSSVTQVDGYTEAEADAEFVNDPNGAITVDGNGNVLIGTDAGDSFNSDSRLRIGNSGDRAFLQFKTDTSNDSGILFGTETDDVRHQILHDPTDDALIFKNNSAETMRLDASGRVTKPYQPSFRATNGASNTVSADVVFTQKDFDISNSYSTSTGRFTAPLTGTYLFYLTALYTTGSTSPTWKVSWEKNGSFDAVVGEYQSTFNTTSSYHTIFNSTITMSLSSGDYVNIKNLTNKGVHISGTQTKFGGYLLG
jgi:hypothetical protein